MIYGIGTDIVQVERMQELIDKHGDKFLQKIFTAEELNDAEKRFDKIIFLSGRWAAKEAVSKALKCGIGKDCGWKNICVQNDENGAPRVNLSGQALRLVSEKSISNIQISISHEKDYAVALVVMEN